MFFVYHHYDLARLAELQAVLLERRERQYALEADTIIVPNPGVGRWLQIQLAESQGIAANLHTPLLARFIWDLLPKALPGHPDSTEFERSRLRWHLYDILPQLKHQQAEIGRYLDESKSPVLRMQLADQLADVFDQYLIYRPSLLKAWQRHEESQDDAARWQAPVWRALCEKLGTQHRAQWLHEFIHKAQLPQGINTQGLPSTIYCFGLGALPPDYVKFLYALSAHIDVHFLLPNPCEEYWGDISQQKVSLDLALNEHEPTPEPGLDIGHPLLASLGRGTRDLLRILYSSELQEIQTPELKGALDYDLPGDKTLLTRVQSDIIRMQTRDDEDTTLNGDVSVQIHACHGPLREVQVLHDQLLDLLSRDHSLQARDIVVMMPNVNTYAAAIQSVFGSAQGARYLPFSLSDRSRISSHPILQSFRQLLDLPLARFKASEIFDLASVPAVSRRFGLDQASLEQLQDWTRTAGARWGADQQHCQQFSAQNSAQYTWQFAMDRLLLGLCQNQSDVLIDGVAPSLQAEGTAASAIGTLWYFLHRLRYWQQELQRATTAATWQQRFNRLLEEFFQPDEQDPQEQAALAELHKSLAGLEQAADCISEELLDWEVIRAVVLDALNASSERQPFLDRGISFCGMVPLRSVPFRVVCLLGLDDANFPRQEQSAGFNLLRQNPRMGDRNIRDDDRLLFLQALMAAKDVFYLSYTGQDVNSGESIPASVLLTEWLNYLQQHHFKALDEADFKNRIVHTQTLQPFSPRLFQDSSDTSRCFSFAQNWHVASLNAGQTRRAPQAFNDHAQRTAQAETLIELDQVKRFFKNPPAYFLRQCLSIELETQDGPASDEIPLRLDELQKWQLRQQLFQYQQQGQQDWDEPTAETYWLAQAILPPAPLHRKELSNIQQELQPLLAVWREWTQSESLGFLDLAIPLGDSRELRTRLHNVGTAGLRECRVGSLKLRHRIGAWLDYLCLRAQGHPGDLRLAGLNKGQLIQYQACIDETMAREQLQVLLDLFARGQREALLFVPDLAEIYTESLRAGKNREEALHALNAQLCRSSQPHHLMQEPYFRLLAEPEAPLGQAPGDTAFCEIAEELDALMHPHFQQVEA